MRRGRRRGYPRFVRSFPVLALAFALTISGCHCRKQSDEEILHERIDTTSVHLYLATKVAIIKSDTSPEAAEAKKQLVAVLEVLSRAAADFNDTPAAAPSGSAAAPAASAAPPNAASAQPEVQLTAADIAKLAKALYSLKKEGKALLEARREDDLPPILPVLLGTQMSPELRAAFDTNTEHGLFLITLFALKFHHKNPVPVPPEVLLYEAWMSSAETMNLPGMSVPVHAVKAVVYSQNDLCDLSAAEGDGLDKVKEDLTADRIASSMKTFGAKSTVSDENAAQLFASARALAHGSAAICYFQRKEKPKALDSLGKFIDAAHEAGVPSNETALARAYLAYEKEDYEAAKRCLEEAKNDPLLDPVSKKELDALITDFTEKDDSAIAKAFDRTYFSVLITKLVLLRIERTGVFDELLQTEAVQGMRHYLFAATKMLASTKESIPTTESARKRASELLDGLRK